MKRKCLVITLLLNILKQREQIEKKQRNFKYFGVFKKNNY
jgi:hypothetical protein